MSKRTERILLLALDFLTVNLSYYVYYLLRVKSGWFAYPIEPDLILPMLAIYLYWLMLFAFFGLYRSWYAQSRLDELITLFRIVTAGVLVLFFLIFIDDESTSAQTGTRILIGAYWMVMFGFISIGRLAEFLRDSDGRAVSIESAEERVTSYRAPAPVDEDSAAAPPGPEP